MRDFMLKNGPFSQKGKKKKKILCDSKRSSFVTDFFELTFDTADLISQSFRMIKARGCKQRFKSDQLRNYLVPASICLLYTSDAADE